MDRKILEKLKKWRESKAKAENCPLFRIFPNQTLEDIARILPQNKQELLAIKGIREKKYFKYGRELLEIVGNSKGNASKNEEGEGQRENGESDEIEFSFEKELRTKTFSVSGYLDKISENLSRVGFCRIRGEVCEVSFRNHLYFSLKDKEDGSVLNCFMFNDAYQLCGLKIEQGMELIVSGEPQVYKPYGKFSLKTVAAELAGEGQLKQAYEQLKNKLQAEGLFSAERKKPIPDYPRRIGLVTSRDGAVINDFLNNIGNFGYEIAFYDCRVEGALAVGDLIKAVRYFRERTIDVLVMIRGGGSLESLQAFNNENLVREIANLPMPVLCGIGHDKDVPLICFAADLAVSTPSIVAKRLNQGWERAVDKLESHRSMIISVFGSRLQQSHFQIEKSSSRARTYHDWMLRKFESSIQSIAGLMSNMKKLLVSRKLEFDKMTSLLKKKMEDGLSRKWEKLGEIEKSVYQNDPKRQLRLGYSIVTLGGKLVRSAEEVKKGDILENRFENGRVKSEVKEIEKNRFSRKSRSLGALAD